LTQYLILQPISTTLSLTLLQKFFLQEQHELPKRHSYKL